eukprot:TRINITY_DN20737_c0_g2_i1.p1 TRINITY_DN20737_c0_g2~~TRINITY_DN20737_c0_g2_i1.p1  ORF type:complete len:940 (+),score=240.67 TRINITY_DN20737_c0_g2_i1:82-2901(+)
MPPPTPAEVKRNLNFVWGKESDLNETYNFEFSSGNSWICIRSNHGESRRFRLSFDPGPCRLWWGESYFTDPADLARKPERLQWYRAADKAKSRGAFLWKRLREAKPGNLEANQLSEKKASAGKGVKGAGSNGPPAASVPLWQAKAKTNASTASGLSRSQQAMEDDQEEAALPATAGPSKNGGGASKSSSSSSSAAMPEVILDMEQMLVIYKPPFWKVELPPKDAPAQDGKYLPRWLQEKVPGIKPELFEEEFNPALSGTGFGPLSHRIDQETSGPMLVAKTAEAQKHLRAQFHKTEVSKRYLCLVHGRMRQASGTLDAPIRTLRTNSSTRSEISSAGDWAETDYHAVATFNGNNDKRGYTLVACDIKSGRTHQIRIHMQHSGHPLVTDEKYSVDEVEKDKAWCPRLFLHCFRLRFKDLRNEDTVLHCPLPPDLKGALLKLGAPDPQGHGCDRLFDETSWQWEVFRPPLTSWRPGSAVQRRLITLLSSSSEPVPLNALIADEELKRLLAEDGLQLLTKAWLSKNLAVFAAVRSSEGELCLQLRPSHAIDGIEEGGLTEVDLDRQIEAVRSEHEELQRLKERAVAEEKYIRAAEIKRRLEATAAELNSLRALRDEEEGNDGRTAGLLDVSGLDIGKGPADRKANPQRPPEVFKEDVRDEALFPSLPLGSKPAAKKPPVSSTAVRSASATPARGSTSGQSAQSRSQSQAPGGGRGASAAPAATPVLVAVAAEPELSGGVLELKDALLQFLHGKEGKVAHINEVNNDRFLRQVMAAQLPKPVTAVNKAWLGKHEDLFTLLRTADNELYVAQRKAVEENKKNSKSKAPEQKQPAYHKVIQESACEAQPLVYHYAMPERKQEEASTGAGFSWQEKFKEALKQVPENCLSAPELLAAVPLFAAATGATKPREQQELLTMFLGEWPKLFKVEKRGSGAERKFMVHLK